MYRILETQKEVREAQRQLETSIRRRLSRAKKKDVSYPGGRAFDRSILTDGISWFSSFDFKGDIPRRLNWFGRYRDRASLKITVEMNVASTGHTERVSSFFAKDDASGVVYLFHSGRVGGGAKGVGKKNFLAWTSRPLDAAVDSEGNVRHAILVTSVTAKDAAQGVLNYVKDVAAFKQAVRDGEISTEAFEKKLKRYNDYYSEFRGRKRGGGRRFDYVSRHGEVVDALEVWRRSRHMPRGGQTVKDILIDLGVVRGGKLIEVYEVKSNSSRQTLYGAIGQLAVHGTNGCRRFLVLPEGDQLADDVSAGIRELGIEVLRFKLTEREARIVVV